MDYAKRRRKLTNRARQTPARIIEAQACESARLQLAINKLHGETAEHQPQYSMEITCEECAAARFPAAALCGKSWR